MRVFPGSSLWSKNSNFQLVSDVQKHEVFVHVLNKKLPAAVKRKRYRDLDTGLKLILSTISSLTVLILWSTCVTYHTI